MLFFLHEYRHIPCNPVKFQGGRRYEEIDPAQAWNQCVEVSVDIVAVATDKLMYGKTVCPFRPLKYYIKKRFSP